MAVMKLTPPASPSTPSRRLMALVMATIHRTVRITEIAVAKEPPKLISMRIPTPTSSRAESSCTSSRKTGGNPNWSSMKPAMIKKEPPSRMASTCTWTSWISIRRSKVAITRARTTDAKMARPPALGRGSSLRRRALGLSAHPTLIENRRTRGMNHQAANAAMTKVRMTATQPQRPGAAIPRAFRKSIIQSSIAGASYHRRADEHRVVRPFDWCGKVR